MTLREMSHPWTVDYLRIFAGESIPKQDNYFRLNEKETKQVGIHELGGVRMGKDPKTYLLKKWNQLHYCKNVHVPMEPV